MWNLGDAATADLMQRAERVGCNLRQLAMNAVGIAFDETTTDTDIEMLMSLFRGSRVHDFADDRLDGSAFRIPQGAVRTSPFLTHPVFNTHDTETEMLRYLRRLESRDLSLTTSMIPLGSCTMKLNATRGDVSGLLAGVCAAASFRAGIADRRLSRHVRATGSIGSRR